MANFYGGIKSKDYFPWSDDVFSLQYLSTSVPNKALAELMKDNYGKNDAGSISQDLNVLNSMDNDARATNDFYNGGSMERYMKDWINYTQRIRDLKNDLNPSDVASNIVKYNDHLEERKREYCGYLLKSSCYSFNNARHVKTKAWDESYEYTICGITYSGTIHHPATYYYIEGLSSVPYSNPEGIAALASAMEKESGISFMSPRDWKSKIKRT